MLKEGDKINLCLQALKDIRELTFDNHLPISFTVKVVKIIEEVEQKVTR